MQTLFESIDLGLNHVQIMVRGMFAVAQCDGVHATELVLLREFYSGCQQAAGGLADFDDLVRVPFDAETACDVLESAEHRQVFLRSCLLLAFADGGYSSGERAKITEFAGALEVDSAILAELEDQVRDHLLRQVASIQNIDALRAVANEMG